MIETNHAYAVKVAQITRLAYLRVDTVGMGSELLALLYEEIDALRAELKSLHSGNHMMQRPLHCSD